MYRLLISSFPITTSGPNPILPVLSSARFIISIKYPGYPPPGPGPANRRGHGFTSWRGSLLAAAAPMALKGPLCIAYHRRGIHPGLDSSEKNGEQFRNIRWWIAVALTALFTLPELYCLYAQFDLHPEKQVFGHTGVSGIRFFFWDSQFGRFFNTGPIKGNGDPFFYFHTLLWAFLPWSLLLYAAVIQKCRSIRRAIPGDWICAGAALASFVLFSLSRFQLPHYLNILFPFFSILTAGWLYNIRRKGTQQFVRVVQGIINVILPILLLLLCWFFHFPHGSLLLAGLSVLSVLPFLLFRGTGLPVSFIRSFWQALLAFAFLNFLLYPAILQYQAGTQAARWIGRSANIPAVYLLKEGPVNYSFSLEFYSPVPVRRIPMDSISAVMANGPVIVFAPAAFADSLSRKGYHISTLREFPNFHISQLTGEFLNYRTRDPVLEKYALVQCSSALEP